MIALRDYQRDAIDDIRSAIRAGNRRVLLHVPTGGGKTLMAASVLASALAKGSRSLFVAHRMELIDQAVATFARLGIESVGVIRARDPRTAPEQPIQVASVQTLVRRDLPAAKIVVIDEAHRACAASYQRLIDHYADSLVIGLSATPVRVDGKPLGQAFSAMVHGGAYSRLIADGHLVAPDVYSTPDLPDLARVHTTAGDYDAKDLDAAVNRSALIGSVVRTWQRYGSDRRTVVFAVSVAHSRAIVEQFAATGVRAEHLDGTTPESERRALLARLAAHETQVVSNVGVLCEGWDLPECKCLVLARPTKSLALYMQMAGRILRPWRGVVPIILDHGGNVDRHGFPHEDREWSLAARAKRGGAAPVKTCPSCYAMVAYGVRVCPHCAHEWSAAECAPAAEPETIAHVELALRTLEQLTGGDEITALRLASFRQIVQFARKRGWRPGAVNHRFRERHKVLPPLPWWRALKRAYAQDSEWRAKVAARGVDPRDYRRTEAT